MSGYIAHLTLTTGDMSRIYRGDVEGEELARVRPWLAASAGRGEHPLPVSALADYTAWVDAADGATIVTVFGPGPAGPKKPPLVTFGVASRSRHSRPLWAQMTAPHMPAVAPGVQMPAYPWCATAIWPTVVLDLAATRWLGDFERCCAAALVWRTS